jgi:hypothetical protein
MVTAHFHMFLLMDVLRFNIFTRGHAAFELGKAFRNLSLPIVWSLKAALNFPKVSVAFFSGLKQNLMQQHCSVKSAIF